MMVNKRYTKCNEHFGKADIDLIDDDIRIALLTSNEYTPDLEEDEFLSDIPNDARLFVMAEGITGKAITDGIFSCDNILCSSILSGTVDYIVMFKYTGDDSTSLLIALFDSGNNLPVTPGDADVDIRWSVADNKIFRI